MRPVIDFPSRGMSTETVPLNRVRWTLLSITILRHVTVHTPSPALKRRSSLRKVTPYVKKKKKKKKTQRCFKRGAIYLVAVWCRCLLWLSHFLCIRSLARQQWWGNVNGLQILKEERSGETEAAMFVCVCVVWRGCTSCVYACARGRGGGGGAVCRQYSRWMVAVAYCTCWETGNIHCWLLNIHCATEY